MTLCALSYKSQALRCIEESDLNALLFASRAFNAHCGVTGVLLVCGRQFFQYIEGPEPELQSVFARVEASRLHHEIQVLFRGSVPFRLFDTWHMGCGIVPESIFLSLASKDWEEARAAGLASWEQAPPIQALLSAWRSAQGADGP